MGNDPELNVAFAEAMAPLYEKYSGNLDVTAIYVEALMNLKAWQLWDKNTATGEIHLQMTTPSSLSRSWKMPSIAARKPKFTLRFATCIVTLLNSHRSQSEHCC